MGTHLRITQSLADEQPIEYAKLGIVGDGKTYDHAGVANLASAIEEGGAVHLGGAPTMLLGETVDWSRLKGRLLTSDRLPFPDGENAPRFTWDGAPYGTMLLWDRLNHCQLDGIAFETEDPTGAREPAGIAIDVDGGTDTRTDPSEREIGTACRFTRLRHITHAPNPDVTVPRSQRPNADGTFETIQVPAPIFIALGTRTMMNQEYHWLSDCHGHGNGAGTFLFQGASPNIVATRVRDSGATAYKRGIWMHGGSMHLDYINLSACEWGLWMENGSQVSTATRLHGEWNKHFAYLNTPLESWGNKLDPEGALPYDPGDRGWIHFGGLCHRLMFRGNLDGNLPPGAVVMTFDNDQTGCPFDIELTLNQHPLLTRQQLGIDRAALMGRGNKKNRVRFLTFRTQPWMVDDLKSGRLDWNIPATTVEHMTTDMEGWANSADDIGNLQMGPVPWDQLTPGTRVDYVDTASGYIRRQMCFPDGSYATMPVGAYKKVKP